MLKVYNPFRCAKFILKSKGETQNMKVFPRVLLALTAVLCLQFAVAQNAGPVRSDEDKKAYKSAMEVADQKIYDEVKAHSELMKNLEYLTSNIGARLTGSKQMQEASDWTLQRFKDYGISAHLEATQIAHAYNRGVDSAEITSPVLHRVAIRALEIGRAHV